MFSCLCLTFVLSLYQTLATVFLAQSGFLDFSGGVTGNLVKNNLVGALVTGQCFTEIVDVHLTADGAGLYLDDSSRNLYQTMVGQANLCHIMDSGMSPQEILDLHRV